MHASAIRALFGIVIGTLTAILILPSCSTFERKNEPPAGDQAAVTDQKNPEMEVADHHDIHQAPIQTPEQAAANPAPETKTEEATPEKDAAHDMKMVWGYSGVIGPDVWGKLDPTFKLCGSGKRQSPIDLKWSKPKQAKDIQLNYKNSPLTVLDTGHTLQVNFKEGNTVDIRGETYELVQMHFHSSSEHTLSGNQLPMEAHLVHKNSKGQLAVLGVILIEGQTNPAIQQIWNNWPSKKNSEVTTETSINPQALIPDIKTHYNYTGSLTTPPCSEGVNWNVFNTPLELSKSQLLAFRKRYPSNNRPIQALNGRKVTNY